MVAEYLLLWYNMSVPSVKFSPVFLISIRDGMTDGADAQYSGLYAVFLSYFWH